jgi:hypothetical protein
MRAIKITAIENNNSINNLGSETFNRRDELIEVFVPYGK